MTRTPAWWCTGISGDFRQLTPSGHRRTVASSNPWSTGLSAGPFAGPPAGSGGK